MYRGSSDVTSVLWRHRSIYEFLRVFPTENFIYNMCVASFSALPKKYRVPGPLFYLLWMSVAKQTYQYPNRFQHNFEQNGRKQFSLLYFKKQRKHIVLRNQTEISVARPESQNEEEKIVFRAFQKPDVW